MATVLATATAVPQYRFTLEDTKRYFQHATPLGPERIAAIHAIFDNARVQQRYSPFPVEHFTTPRSLDQVSAEYREHAIHLGRRVAADCLAQAGIASNEIDFLITVSCTGVMLPSLDAYLINELGFRTDVRRLPITELGCAAGAAALAHARDFIAAHPGSTVLVVAVELASLTFQAGDTSMSNLVSCALFGDGAAAALVTGRDTPGVRILDSASRLFPDSYEALGFELRDGGLHIVLGKQLPAMIRSQIREIVAQFLGRHCLKPDALSFFVIHPGGRKLIEQIEQDFHLAREQTQPTWDILRDYGNLSSASVLFVLREWMTKRPQQPGDLGLMVAFGPGFSAEMLLLQWA